MNGDRGRAVVPRGSNRDTDTGERIGAAILGFLGDVPQSREQPSPTPATAAREVARRAAAKAATAAGSLALPPGPLGWLTVLPEMVAVWRLQATMVADIAALYDRTGTLTREQMLYCLFKHTASQAVRDLVVRAGERWLVKKASQGVLQAVARRIGMRMSERAVASAASRWLPVIGAAGVASYAYYDTTQVAKAAIALFEGGVVLEEAQAPGQWP